MTRINVVPVRELSDQWLLAEYHELPRCIKQEINTTDAPEQYCLGKGHMKWAKKHSVWLMNRYHGLCNEIEYRGFNINYPFYKLLEVYFKTVLLENDNDYSIKDKDIHINQQRLIEKYNLKPNYYKWTKRDKPKWLEV